MTEFNTGTKVTADHRKQWTGTVASWTENEIKYYSTCIFSTHVPVLWEFGTRYIERIETLRVVHLIECKYCDDQDYTDFCKEHDLDELILLGFLKERGVSGKTMELARWDLKNKPYIKNLVRDSKHLNDLAKVFIWAFDMGWIRAMENPERKENE